MAVFGLQRQRSKSSFTIAPLTAGLLIATPNVLLILYFFVNDVNHAKPNHGPASIRKQPAMRGYRFGQAESVLTEIRLEIVKLEEQQLQIQKQTSLMRDDLGKIIKQFYVLQNKFKNRSYETEPVSPATILAVSTNSSETDSGLKDNVTTPFKDIQQQQQQQPIALIDEILGKDSDLALGVVDSLHEEYTSIFVLSLRRFSPSCDIVLFLKASSTRLDALLKAHGVVTVRYTEEDVSPAAMRNQSSLTYRWVMFERFLDLQGKKYRRVLLADVVQVAFQSSPFDILTGEGLYAFSESISLSQDVWTTNWIRACFESSVLAQLGNKETLNVGYVTGTIDRILPYVRVMAATVRNVTRADGCRGEGVDQGVHNVVAYTDASASDLVVQNQNQGAVAELQSPFAMTYNAGIRAVVNGMGKPAAVVLRYYNVPEVMRLLFHSYVEWDVHNVSRGRGGCWRYMLMTHVELFKGHGDFADSSVERVASPLGCCELCDKNQMCNGFTHFDQTCWMKSISRAPKPEEGFPVPESTSGWKIF